MVLEIKSLDRDGVKKVMSVGKKSYIEKNMKFVYTKGRTETVYVSFSISKKVEKLATDRNRMKRIMRGALEKNKPNLKSFSGLFFIYNKEHIKETMIKLLKQERLLN
ncbi:MAG: ribonuclease P protein component [Candidatus Campbellbacteria bacterium]|nr:ribonuclease P protein component [Candidatus Campbellbacteria bacterium]